MMTHMETLPAPNLPIVNAAARFRDDMAPATTNSSTASGAVSGMRFGAPAGQRVGGVAPSPGIPQSQSQSPSQSQSQSRPQPQSQIQQPQQDGPSSAGFRSYATAPASSQGSTGSVASTGRVSSTTTATTGTSTSMSSLGSGNAVDDAETVLTSPVSTSPSSRQHVARLEKLAENWGPNDSANSVHHVAANGQGGDQSMSAPHSRGRFRTPEEQNGEEKKYGVLTSPLGLVSPTTRHKRTASGLVKQASAVSPILGSSLSPAREGREGRGGRERRGDSVSSSGSRAGEAAAQLKTRLAYAMAKVQHGWQNHNIDQVEALAATLPSRTIASSPPAAVNTTARGLTSPRTAITNGASRLSMLDNRPIPYPDHYSMQSPPSKRRSGAGIVSWAGNDTIIPASTNSSHHRADSRNAPSLAPAADIRPIGPSPPHTSTHRRNLSNISNSSSTLTQPPLLRNHSSEDRVSGPRTPKAKRSMPALRTNASTAQAEQDAMDALMLMGGSPSRSQTVNSHHAQSSQLSSSQPAPASSREAHVLEPSSSSQPVSAGEGNGTMSQRSANQLLSPRGKQSGISLVRQTLERASSNASSLSAIDGASDGSDIAGSVMDLGGHEGSSQASSSESASLGSSEGSRTREGRERVLDEAEEGGS